MLRVGSCFSIPTPPKGHHIFIAIAEAAPDRFLCVNVTTRRKTSELTCVLNPSDHPKIIHESVINYKDARIISQAQFNALHRDGRCSTHNNVDGPVLDRIKKGGSISKRLANKFKKLLN